MVTRDDGEAHRQPGWYSADVSADGTGEALLVQSDQIQGPLTWSPSGAWIMGGTAQGELIVWPAEGGEPAWPPRRLRDDDRAQWSADGRYLVIIGRGKYQLRDPATGRLLATMPAQPQYSLSPTSRYLLTISAAGRVAIEPIWPAELKLIAEQRLPRQLTEGEHRRFNLSPAAVVAWETPAPPAAPARKTP
jgi:hypothetical protein